MSAALAASTTASGGGTTASQQPGSASFGYSWVPPGLNRKKVRVAKCRI
jgi:hypothetical protein